MHSEVSTMQGRRPPLRALIASWPAHSSYCRIRSGTTEPIHGLVQTTWECLIAGLGTKPLNVGWPWRDHETSQPLPWTWMEESEVTGKFAAALHESWFSSYLGVVLQYVLFVFCQKHKRNGVCLHSIYSGFGSVLTWCWKMRQAGALAFNMRRGKNWSMGAYAVNISIPFESHKTVFFEKGVEGSGAIVEDAMCWFQRCQDILE